MHPRLPKAPIDEVVVGFVFDRPVGPDAVESGVYLAERRDRFASHEMHDPVFEQANALPPFPIRTWLVSPDKHWLVQLQHDRFHANWRRLDGANYPGFTADGGVMSFALTEFERLRDFCRRHKGEAPSPKKVEVSKIDLLVQGVHWRSIDDAYEMLPAMASAGSALAAPGPDVAMRTRESINGMTLSVSIDPARLIADPQKVVFRVDFQVVQSARDELDQQLSSMSDALNAAFRRLIPDAERRFK